LLLVGVAEVLFMVAVVEQVASAQAQDLQFPQGLPTQLQLVLEETAE